MNCLCFEFVTNLHSTYHKFTQHTTLAHTKGTQNKENLTSTLTHNNAHTFLLMNIDQNLTNFVYCFITIFFSFFMYHLKGVCEDDSPDACE